ncbi:MAG: hypothetical protein ACRCY3_00490, partial [Sphingorhabdus sp.]
GTFAHAARLPGMQKLELLSPRHPFSASGNIDNGVFDPKEHFKSPEMLIADSLMSDREKYDLLRKWDLNLSNRLEARKAVNPCDSGCSDLEAELVDELERLRACLTEMAIRLGND